MLRRKVFYTVLVLVLLFAFCCCSYREVLDYLHMWEYMTQEGKSRKCECITPHFDISLENDNRSR